MAEAKAAGLDPPALRGIIAGKRPAADGEEGAAEEQEEAGCADLFGDAGDLY